jgi:uncharacterized membrane protein
MATLNRDLMQQARDCLKGKWNIAVGGTALIFVMSLLGAIPGVGFIIALLITGPLSVGYAIYFLAFSRKGDPKIPMMFEGFSRFGTALAAYLLVGIFVILWMLLLIVPGIIAALRYSQTFFILADNPSMRATEAINKSKAMMLGNKYKLFCLGCRFIGWILLGIVTVGIGYLWIYPYIMTSFAKFYEDIKTGSETVVTTESAQPNA